MGKQWKEQGILNPAPVVRPYKKIDPEKLKAYVEEHPDAYPEEIAKEFKCCETAIRNAFKRLHITRKKATHYREQDPEKVKAYQEAIADIVPEQIAYVDETGIDIYLYRTHGYAPRGQQIDAVISG